jgi:hypothetical protein
VTEASRTYGSTRIYKALKAAQIPCSRSQFGGRSDWRIFIRYTRLFSPRGIWVGLAIGELWIASPIYEKPFFRQTVAFLGQAAAKLK